MNVRLLRNRILSGAAIAVVMIASARYTYALGVKNSRLTPPNLAPYRNFGWSVSLDGALALVSANHNDHAGLVAVYNDSGNGHWLNAATLTPTDSHRGDEFGWSTSLDHSTALIGAPRYGSDGAAYVFEMDQQGNWQETAQLKPTGAVAPNDFGYSVSLSGTTALVGAYSEGRFSGAAYAFEKNQHGAWSQTARLQPEGAVGRPEFGSSVSVSGSTAIIGASTDNWPTGAAYIFRKDADGQWDQHARLSLSGLTEETGFGSRVAIEGTTAIVSASGVDGQAGAAFVFREDEFGNWNQIAKLTPDDPQMGKQFGTTVSISGSKALIGSVNYATTDAAYVFEEDEFGNWNQIAKFQSDERSQGGAFGYSVELDGNNALVGDMFGNQFLGAAYVFRIPEPGAAMLVLTGIPWFRSIRKSPRISLERGS